MPALLTSTSSPPSRATASATARGDAGGVGHVDRIASSPSATSRSRTITRAPALAQQRRPTAAPIPDAPPVTIARTHQTTASIRCGPGSLERLAQRRDQPRHVVDAPPRHAHRLRQPREVELRPPDVHQLVRGLAVALGADARELELEDRVGAIGDDDRGHVEALPSLGPQRLDRVHGRAVGLRARSPGARARRPPRRSRPAGPSRSSRRSGTGSRARRRPRCARRTRPTRSPPRRRRPRRRAAARRRPRVSVVDVQRAAGRQRHALERRRPATAAGAPDRRRPAPPAPPSASSSGDASTVTVVAGSASRLGCPG